MIINKTDLIYFLELSNTLHITRAAERLGISQPALSHCIKRMELDLKCELFIRSKKGVKLTSAGEILKKSAFDLVKQWENIGKNIHSEINGIQGTIKLGCHPAIAKYYLPPFLGHFLKENPNLEIELAHGLSRHMTEQIISSWIDVAIAVNPNPHDDLIIKELCKDEFTLWSTKNCQNLDLLIYDPSLLQTQTILSKIHKKGMNFKRKMISSDLEVITNLMCAGVGVGILPERLVRSMKGFHCEMLKGAPQFQDRICLIYKREFRKLKRGQIFIEAISKLKV